MDDRPEIFVNGAAYGGWTRARIVRGVESLAGSFDLEVSDRWNGQESPWPIQEEDACEINVAGEVLMMGYVDKRALSYSASEHTLRVSGRDRTGLLVDCSAVPKSWEFKSMTILDLASELCRPFGIAVSLDVDAKKVTLTTGKTSGTVTGAGKSGHRSGLGIPKPPKKFCVNPGDSVFEVLDRACRMAGVIPVSDGRGGLLLTRGGTARAATPLVEGQNILAASADYDCAGRYRTYVVSGQRQGGDEEYGSTVAAVKATATDEGVSRASRVLLIRPEASVTAEAARMRAGWEAKIRAARGDSVSVTVQGWRQSNGDHWPVNALVNVQSPTIGIKGDMLITQVELSLDESGTTARITLKRPDAFLPEPVTTKASAGLWKEIAKGV